MLAPLTLPSLMQEISNSTMMMTVTMASILVLRMVLVHRTSISTSVSILVMALLLRPPLLLVHKMMMKTAWILNLVVTPHQCDLLVNLWIPI